MPDQLLGDDVDLLDVHWLNPYTYMPTYADPLPADQDFYVADECGLCGDTIPWSDVLSDRSRRVVATPNALWRVNRSRGPDYDEPLLTGPTEMRLCVKHTRETAPVPPCPTPTPETPHP